MMHDKRTFAVKSYASLPTMCHALTDHTWCLCNGFRYGPLVLLNDSFSEDGTAEFAVYDEHRNNGTQIESITVSWCTAEKLEQYLSNWLTRLPLMAALNTDMPRIEDAATHQRCRYCA